MPDSTRPRPGAFFSANTLNARSRRSRVKQGDMPQGLTRGPAAARTARQRESSLLRAIRLAVNMFPGARFWRNNVAEWKNQATGSYVRAGLARGSSDLVGLVHGKFVALEIKTPGGRTNAKRAREQLAWRDTVKRFGGVAEVVQSVDDAIRVLEEVSRG